MAFTGRYRKAVDEVVYIRKEKDYLVERINDGGDIYCFPVSKDSLVFTDFNVKGGVRRNEKGAVMSLQTVWQKEPMPWMREDEFSPSEYLKQKKYNEAKLAFRQMNLNEYQITYLVYELLNKKQGDMEAIKTILALAEEQHPSSAIVSSRWGDYYLKLGDRKQAIVSYRRALSLDPND